MFLSHVSYAYAIGKKMLRLDFILVVQIFSRLFLSQKAVLRKKCIMLILLGVMLSD